MRCDNRPQRGVRLVAEADATAKDASAARAAAFGAGSQP